MFFALEYLAHYGILLCSYIIPCLWFAFPRYTEYVNQNTSVEARQIAYEQVASDSNFYLLITVNIILVFQCIVSIKRQFYLLVGTSIGYILVFFFEISPIVSWSQLWSLEKLLWACFVTLCMAPSMREINFKLQILATEPQSIHVLLLYLILFFNWIGAFVIPLDWERPYQQFPICCLFGNAIGLVIVVTISIIYVQRSEKKKKQ